MSALADLAEFEIEVVADDKDVFGSDFIKVGESPDGGSDVVIEGLRLDKDGVALFLPDGVELFVRFPFKARNFEIKIKRQKTEIMTGKIVFCSGVAEGDNEFHEDIIAVFERFWVVMIQ